MASKSFKVDNAELATTILECGSIKATAAHYSVNPMTISKRVDELCRLGLIKQLSKKKIIAGPNYELYKNKAQDSNTEQESNAEQESNVEQESNEGNQSKKSNASDTLGEKTQRSSELKLGEVRGEVVDFSGVLNNEQASKIEELVEMAADPSNYMIKEQLINCATDCFKTFVTRNLKNRVTSH